MFGFKNKLSVRQKYGNNKPFTLENTFLMYSLLVYIEHKEDESPKDIPHFIYVSLTTQFACETRF